MFFIPVFIQGSNKVWRVLCLNIQRNLGQEHIGANAAGGNGAHGVVHVANYPLGQLSGRNVVHLQVWSGINEGFVDRVGEDILRCKVFEKDTVDLCSAIDIQLHPRWSNNVFDVAWNIPDPASVLDAQRFHTGRDSETDLIFSSRLSKVEKSIVTQRLITD